MGVGEGLVSFGDCRAHFVYIFCQDPWPPCPTMVPVEMFQVSLKHFSLA